MNSRFIAELSFPCSFAAAATFLIILILKAMAIYIGNWNSISISSLYQENPTDVPSTASDKTSQN